MSGSVSFAATQFLAREDGHIAYEVTGDRGPWVIALPGMGDLRMQYRFLVPRLVQSGYRVVTMDVRGQGESSVHWQDYSARAAGADVLALLRHLGADKAVVLGNSFAAGAGLWAARDRPDQVQAIGMLGPILRDLPASWLTRLVVQLGFAGPWRRWFWMTYWDSLFPWRKPDDQAAYRALLEANLGEQDRMAVLRTMVALSKSDTEALLDHVTVPVLVVMGTRDPDFSDATAEAYWLAGRLKAQVSLVDGAGHYPHVEAPERVAYDIVQFLDGLEGR